MWIPKGGITSSILDEVLHYIDSLDVFEITDVISPFLLLGRHNSRFDLPFLEYITDNQHEWKVYIELHYGMYR